MATTVSGLRQRTAWKALEEHYEEVKGAHLRDLFASDPGRGERMTAEAEGIFLDYSKNRVTEKTMELLLDLARESGLEERREAMFSGQHMSAALLRAP